MPGIDSLYSGWLRLGDYMQTGGLVMWPLAAISIVMWLLIVERVFFVRRLNRKGMSFQIAWQHVQDGLIPNPRQYGGAVSLLVSRFIGARSGDDRMDCHILDETVMCLNRSLFTNLSIIGVLAAVAPLLGLLGTVTGMIATFDVLAVFGTGNAKAMAGG
ncbi:MAG: MotA/TolQ/ExbB proton channel family protein, partial [Desulfopila sp.]